MRKTIRSILRKVPGLAIVLAASMVSPASASASDECVVFLHGLARTANSMEKIAETFEANGYAIANIDYPSRQHPVEILAPLAVQSGLDSCEGSNTVHFVTHSLGGILIRYYLQENTISNLGRVVMLAPPNNGSEVVDSYRNVPGYKALNGPAGLQLGTDENSIITDLQPVRFEVGVIAGTRTFNPILSQFLPNPDDGKVSVQSTRVEGMTDFMTVERTHTFIMQAPDVIAQTLAFIQNGKFETP